MKRGLSSLLPKNIFKSSYSWILPSASGVAAVVAYALCQAWVIVLPQGAGILPTWGQWIGFGFASLVFGFVAGMCLVGVSRLWWALSTLAILAYAGMLTALCFGLGDANLGTQLYAFALIFSTLLAGVAAIILFRSPTPVVPVGLFVVILLAATWIWLEFFYVSSTSVGGGTISGSLIVTGSISSGSFVSAPQGVFTHVNPSLSTSSLPIDDGTTYSDRSTKNFKLDLDTEEETEIRTRYSRRQLFSLETKDLFLLTAIPKYCASYSSGLFYTYDNYIL